MPELVGSPLYGTYTTDVDTYIDVPDCDLVIVVDASYRYEGVTYSASLGGRALTVDYKRIADGADGPTVMSLKKPDAGSKRLLITSNGDPLMSDGAYYVIFSKGASTYGPVRSVSCDGAMDSITIGFTPKDYDYIFLCAIVTDSDVSDIRWQNATELRSDEGSSYERSIAFNNGGDNVDIQAEAYHLFSHFYILLVGVVLAPSAVIVWVR